MIDVQLAPSWLYQPVGPFTVTAVCLNRDTKVLPLLETFATLVEALRFFERNRSPLPERSVLMFDAANYTVVAYNTSSRHRFNWIGVAAPFDVMRHLGALDETEVMCAEIEARTAWDPDD